MASPNPQAGSADPAGGSYIPDAAGAYGGAQLDPLVIDVSGLGLHLVARSAATPYFDLTGSGFAHNMGWIGSGTGFLAVAGADGLVKDGTQLFGTGGQDGFAALRALDSNGDGVIDAADPGFAKLVVWQDLNGDGIAEAGEVSSLAALGIVSLSLKTTTVQQASGDATIVQTALATMADGSTREVAEAKLDVSSVYTRYVGAFTADPAVAALPILKGYGTLPDLSVSMSQDAQLKALVQQLVQVDPADIPGFDTALRAVLYRWAGVDGVAPASGNAFDGQQLGFLQKLLGNTGVFGTIGSAPVPWFVGQSNLLQESWNAAFAGIKARLLVQLPDSPFANAFQVDPSGDLVVPTSALSVLSLASAAPQGATQVAYWVNALTVINASAGDLGQYARLNTGALASSLRAIVPSLFSTEILSAAASGTLNFVEGTALNARLAGITGSDLFLATQANPVLTGFGGGDEFIVASGLGTTEISEVDDAANPSNVLLLGPGIDPNTVAVSGDASGDIILTLATGDQVKLDNMLVGPHSGYEQTLGHDSATLSASTSYGVQRVLFGDGTAWTAQQLVAAELRPGANTHVYGTGGADVIDGGGVASYEQGNGGSDAFLFNRGYGAVEIRQQQASPSDSSVLKFGAGIQAADVAVTADGSGNITLTVGANGDQVTLDGMMSGNGAGVQAVLFADGTTWSAAQVATLATTGTPGNDRLYGSSAANAFDGKGGADYEQGNGGGDTFAFNAGYGTLEINEYDSNPQDMNVLALGSGIDPAGIRVTGDTSGDIILSTGTAGDKVTLDGMLNGPRYGVEVVQFANGTKWTASQLIALETTGTTGSDLLYGTSGADTFDGKGGTDYAQGNGGGDTFVFNTGYGTLEINEKDYVPGDDNVLRLGAGIGEGQVSITADTAGDVILTIGSGGDQVKLDAMLDGSQYGVQAVQFADGALWSAHAIVSSLPAAAVQNPAAYFDTIAFNIGDGQVSAPAVSPGAIQLGAGITAADLLLQADAGGDLILKLRGSNDSLTVRNDLSYQSWGVASQVSEIRFSDGSVLALPTSDNRQPLGLTWAATPANLTLAGSNFGNNTFILAPGGDSIVNGNGKDGGPGGNTYVFDKGDGQAVVSTNGGSGIVQLGADIAPADVVLQADNAGDLVVKVLDTGDSLTFLNALTVQDYYGNKNVLSAVSKIEFGDGSVQALQQTLSLNPTMLQFEWIGTGSRGTLVGSNFGSNEFVVGPGGAKIIGGDGAITGLPHVTNTYVFAKGDGHATVLGGGAGTVQMAAGISAADVILQADAAGDLTIALRGDPSDSITINADLTASTFYGNANVASTISAVSFADGSALSLANAVGLNPKPLQFTWAGATGTPVAGSKFGSNTFTFAPGSSVTGGDGENNGVNTYVFAKGDGHATVLGGGAGTVQMAAGISAADVILQADAAGDLTIALRGDPSDSITINADLTASTFYGNANVASTISAVSFADGSALSLANAVGLNPKPLQFTWAGATGTPVAGSKFGSNTFTFAPGSSVTGGDGENNGVNTYVFAKGDGHATVLGGGAGTVQMAAGISAADVILQADAAGDLTIALRGDPSDSITINADLTASTFYGNANVASTISAVSFADGSALSLAKAVGLNPQPLQFTWTGSATSAPMVGSKFGSNTYVFAKGDGHVSVNTNDALGIVQFGPGISVNDFSETKNSDGSLSMLDGLPGDEVLIQPGYDPAKLSTQFLINSKYANVEVGASGSDRLYGTLQAEILDGRGAPAGSQDYENGNGGNDTFIYNQGYGQLEVDETDYNSPHSNILQLGAGISATQVTVTGDGSGNAYLTDGTTGDQVRLDNELNNNRNGVQQVSFADGTTWSQAQLVALASVKVGTTGADRLSGSGQADTFDGKGAPAGSQDYENGGGGNDTFIYDQGYGQLEVDETDYNSPHTNTLQFGAGINAAQVTVTGDGSGSAYLTDGTTGDQVRLDNELNNNRNGVQQVSFADGTVWSQAQLVALASVKTGTTGADRLSGSGQADTFDGRGAPVGSQDYENGNGGNDTFIYNQGYGQLEVDETDYNSPHSNILQLGAGISATQVTVTGDGSGNAYLTDGTTGDQVRLDNELNNNRNGVQQVSFADGTTWSQAQLVALASIKTGTTGADSLSGGSEADTFDGKGAPAGLQDYERGGGGGDTFIYNPGYGQLEISENDFDQGTDVVKVGGSLTAAQVTVTGDGSNNIYLADGIAGDQVKLDGEVYSAPYYGVQSVQFSDGSSLSKAQMISLEHTASITNQTLYGSNGGDVFLYNPGTGSIQINETDYSASRLDILQFGAGVTASQITATSGNSGSVLLSDGVAGDLIQINRQLDSSGYYGLDKLQFSDGSALTRQQIGSLLPHS